MGRSTLCIAAMFDVLANVFYHKSIGSLLVIVAILCAATLPVLGDITIDPDGLGYTDVNPDPAITTSNESLYVGNTSTGELRIDGGSSVINRAGVLALRATGTGYVTVDGSGSSWNNNNLLYVGHEGSGKLEIINGGQVISSYGCRVGYDNEAEGEVTVDGMKSAWLNTGAGSFEIGVEGTAILNITNGGLVNNEGQGYIGAQGSSTGVVTVKDSGSTWANNSHLTIGWVGNGSLNIANGGHVNNDRGFIGRINGATGTVTVDGTGSSWTSRDF